MKITKEDMASRKRMADLRSKLSDALADVPEITYAELLIVLGEMATRWAGYLRKEELSEEE